jgi:hypothetical protein
MVYEPVRDQFTSLVVTDGVGVGVGVGSGVGVGVGAGVGVGMAPRFQLMVAVPWVILCEAPGLVKSNPRIEVLL